MLSDFIPLSEPCLRGREWEYVKDCLDTGWISSVGSYVSRFEEMVALRCGTKHAIATVNGTAALHVCLQLAGVRANEEVLVSDLTFIAPANAIRYIGAWPVFIDCEELHWQMDISLLADFLARSERRKSGLYNVRTDRRIAAILPVHVLGHPCNMAELQKLSEEYNLPIIEDATESLGSFYAGQPVGSLGLAGCISFNGNKILTTGGGGMIVTNNDALATKARHLTTQAKSDAAEYIHDEVGFNYRLPNVQSAIGCAQMEQLNSHMEDKKRIATHYRESLGNIAIISWQHQATWASPNHWLPTMRVQPQNGSPSAREIQMALSANGIQTRPLWQPMHLSPAHADSEAVFGQSIAEQLYQECLSLPCSPQLENKSLERICQALKSIIV